MTCDEEYRAWLAENDPKPLEKHVGTFRFYRSISSHNDEQRDGSVSLGFLLSMAFQAGWRARGKEARS